MAEERAIVRLGMCEEKIKDLNRKVDGNEVDARYGRSVSSNFLRSHQRETTTVARMK